MGDFCILKNLNLWYTKFSRFFPILFVIFNMSEPTYRQALLNSWKLVWHNKFLWILGICSMILGQWGLGDFVGQMNLFVEEGFAMPPKLSSVISMLSVLNFDNVTAVFLSVWFFVLVAIFIAAVIFVAIVSRGGLISVTSEWYYDRKRLPVKLAWRDGVKSFWVLLFVTVINKLLQTVVILGFSSFLITAAAAHSSFYNILAVVAFVVALFLVLVLESIAIYASCYAVLERVWCGKALKQGWDLFRRHMVVSLELGILLVLLSVGLFVILAVSSIAVLIPFLALWLVAGVSGWYILTSIGLIIATILFIIIGIIAGGIFNAFTTTSWVYLFMKMHHEGVASRVAHHLKNWLNIR